jgi:hypothetical protein
MEYWRIVKKDIVFFPITPLLQYSITPHSYDDWDLGILKFNLL